MPVGLREAYIYTVGKNLVLYNNVSNFISLEVCISFCSMESWKGNHLNKNVKIYTKHY